MRAAGSVSVCGVRGLGANLSPGLAALTDVISTFMTQSFRGIHMKRMRIELLSKRDTYLDAAFEHPHIPQGQCQKCQVPMSLIGGTAGVTGARAQSFRLEG